MSSDKSMNTDSIVDQNSEIDESVSEFDELSLAGENSWISEEDGEEESEPSSGSGFSFACSKCNATFGNYIHKDEHTEKHLRKSICSLCGFEPSSTEAPEKEEEERADKVRIVKDKRSIADCGWCSYLSQRVSDLKNHADGHRKKFSLYCSICRYYAFNEEDLQLHTEKHKVEKRRETRDPWTRRVVAPELGIEGMCREEGRGGEARRNAKCKLNLDSLLERAMFRCCLCGTRPKTEQLFQEHMSTAHMKPGVSYCPYCTFNSTDREQIFQHVLNHLQGNPTRISTDELLSHNSSILDANKSKTFSQ